VSSFTIRTFGDPVLKQRAKDVEEFDADLARTYDAMVDTMIEAVGGGLAAPQVGIGRRFFVYTSEDGPRIAINPEIVESSGETRVEEGCLSIPGLSFEPVRAEVVTLRAFDLDGREYVLEVDGYESRMFQHEVDHLDGVLAIDRLDPDERKQVLKLIREQAFGAGAVPASVPRL
jgi:peptide deformylase